MDHDTIALPNESESLEAEMTKTPLRAPPKRPRAASTGLWDVHDVAEFLRISIRSVQREARAGRLPVLQVCGMYRFDPALIRAYARGEWHPPKAA